MAKRIVHEDLYKFSKEEMNELNRLIRLLAETEKEIMDKFNFSIADMLNSFADCILKKN